ncbi:MAG: hypothetical protein V7711_05160 [Pseudomonadales bacterium]
MKKLLASIAVAATVFSAGASAGTATAGSLFIVESFTYNVSDNVSLNYVESATNVVVATSSSKGSSKVFVGNSDGGTIAACSATSVEDIDTSGCTSGSDGGDVSDEEQACIDSAPEGTPQEQIDQVCGGGTPT